MHHQSTQRGYSTAEVAIVAVILFALGTAGALVIAALAR